ncbi:MAG: IS701 family transposase [Acidobacteria bacterium]|nr:IS701 family transposase [Acidobacteriota bacterium]
MTDAQLDRCGKRLEQYLADLLEPVGRSERRHWGSLYVRGLLLDGERKSIEPMAERLPDGNVQAMQQFVGQSPWEWEPVWERLARRMVAEIVSPSAWVIDDTGFPKQGTHSVGVERQYSGTLGKTGNCQVAVSLHQVTDEADAVLGWRLYLPESWTEDEQRRDQAGIPAEVQFRKKWELALDLIDEARKWGLPDQIVLADTGYGDATAFREQLEARNLAYAVGVPSNLTVWRRPPRNLPRKAKSRGRPARAWNYGEQQPISVKEAAQKARGWKKVRWREGSKGWLHSRFWATRVQPAHGFQDGKPPGKEVWLLVEWPEDEDEPTKYFLCDLPANCSVRRMVKLVKMRWRIEQDYLQLKDELGLDHYEGRSWLGWHHHVTMVMLAHGFLSLETLRNKKNFWVDPAEDAP